LGLLLFIILLSIRTFVPANNKHIIVSASQALYSKAELCTKNLSRKCTAFTKRRKSFQVCSTYICLFFLMTS